MQKTRMYCVTTHVHAYTWQNCLHLYLYLSSMHVVHVCIYTEQALILPDLRMRLEICASCFPLSANPCTDCIHVCLHLLCTCLCIQTISTFTFAARFDCHNLKICETEAHSYMACTCKCKMHVLVFTAIVFVCTLGVQLQPPSFKTSFSTPPPSPQLRDEYVGVPFSTCDRLLLY